LNGFTVSNYRFDNRIPFADENPDATISNRRPRRSIRDDNVKWRD